MRTCNVTSQFDVNARLPRLCAAAALLCAVALGASCGKPPEKALAAAEPPAKPAEPSAKTAPPPETAVEAPPARIARPAHPVPQIPPPPAPPALAPTPVPPFTPAGGPPPLALGERLPIPAALGPLSFVAESSGTNIGYRVRSANDPAVNFVMPSNFLASIVGDPRVPEEYKVNAVLAYPRFAGEMHAAPPVTAEEAAASANHAPVRFESAEHGQLELALDPQRAGYALLKTAKGSFRLPAKLAFSVADNEQFDGNQKAKALLSFPFIEKVEPSAQ